ncbi:unnamed protein product, partial [Timema podura]|nr:unnamed protein product [Timema podura]
VHCAGVLKVGGYDGASRQCLSSVESYNPETDTWCSISEMSARRSGAGVGVLEGTLYAVGGHDGPLVRKSVESYNPDSKSWNPVADMSFCRRNAELQEGSACGLADMKGVVLLFAVGPPQSLHKEKYNYSYMLALMYTLKRDFELANHHAAQDLTLFLENWSHLSPLEDKLRTASMLDLQRAADMH